MSRKIISIKQELLLLVYELNRSGLLSNFFFQAEDGIRDGHVTGVQTCALPILKQENGDIEVVVAGTDPAVVDDFKEGLLEDPERAEVESIQESQWDSPMKVGFEIRADSKTQSDDISNLIKEIELTEDALKQAEYQQQNFYKSLSWRATAPIRWIGNIFK